MKNRFTLRNFLLIVAATFGISRVAVAQQWTAISSSVPAPAQITLTQLVGNQNTIHISIPGFTVENVQVSGSQASILRLSGANPLLESGSPDLVKVTTSLLIPSTAEMGYTVVSSKYTDFENISLAPSQGDPIRTNDPANTGYSYGPVYTQNKFFPETLVSLNRPHIVRDYRGQSVNIFPFHYNPISHVLRVYYDIIISIDRVSESGENPMPAKLSANGSDSEFEQVYDNLFLNHIQTKYAQVSENGRMLVIAYGPFMKAMESFVDWKNSIGIVTEIVDVASIGNASQIKQYVADYYLSKGLTYLLLVGDAAQVPTITTADGASDNSYSYLAGDDHYPDIFVGRFSAETEEQVRIQAERTINYEKNPDPQSTWYESCTGVGSALGPGDDDEYDYQHIRKMLGELKDYNYTSANELFDGDEGGSDANGNPSAQMVVDNINSGKGLMLYIGHGSANSWGTSQFSSSNVASLRNVGKYPFIWSVACSNGNFAENTCLAENLLRASYDGQPTGAIAALMSTTSQSWYPPMEAQDEMVDLLRESKTGNIKHTFGGISMSGCMKMNDTYGIGAYKVTDTWTIFGDPSVMLRTAKPTAIEVNHAKTINYTSENFSLQTTGNDLQATLSEDGIMLGTAIVENGTASIYISLPITGMKVLLTVTGYNRIPYFYELDVVKGPAAITNPQPANFHRMIPLNTGFSWTRGEGPTPTNYIFYLGTNTSCNDLANGIPLSDTFYLPQLELAFNTDYYWHVDAMNNDGKTIGSIYTFRTIYQPDEDFESNDFPRSSWTTQGDGNWKIDRVTAFQGEQSLRSGSIADDKYSSLVFNCEVSSCDFVSFWKKVSSEQGGDYLKFLVDGVEQGSWSGDIDWSYTEYSIEPGHHLLEWRYAKNETFSYGEDGAWIDDIYLPIHESVFAYAGTNSKICPDYSFQTEGVADNFSSVKWISSGDGTFSDSGEQAPEYMPGASDYENGSVFLTMLVQGNPLCSPVQKSLRLTLIQSPIIDFPSDTTLEAGQILKVNIAAPVGASYLWLPGMQTTTQLTIDTTGIGIGTRTYTLQLTNAFGCMSQKTFTVHFIDESKTRDLQENLFTIYPNPAKDQLRVISIPGNLQINNLQIVNSMGQQVYTTGSAFLRSSSPISIALDGLPDGLYFVTIETTEGKSTQKLLING
jgi:hypothetical protein